MVGKNEPADEGLPDGWLKEYRPRKKRLENLSGSRIKSDVFYIDPIGRYEFRSLKAVHRYLESGDLSQCVMLPNKRKIEDVHAAGDQSHHTDKPSCHTHLNVADESNQDDLRRGGKALKNGILNPESGNNAENVPLSKADGVNPVKREADQVKGSEGIIRSGSVENTPGDPQSVASKGANVEQKRKRKKRQTKPVKGVATPLRSSPRLAALKISQEANNAPKDGPTSTDTDITDQSQPKLQKPRQKTNSSPLSESTDRAHNTSFSEKFEDNYPSVPSQGQGASVPYSLAEVGCQNAPAGGGVLPQQVGQGEAADATPGSALSSLFRHVWSDPCLVFAFRILTSDIPVLDDTLAVANYILPQQNLNKGVAPSSCSSAYDGTRNHAQVDHVGLPMPRPTDNLYGSNWFPPQ